MFLKFKIKRAIKEFHFQAGMNRAQVSYILTQSLDRYVHDIKALKNTTLTKISNQNCLERLLVSTAENYMNQLADIDKGNIKTEEDIVKLHFCIAVMIVVACDQWAPMCNQILRLDLWHKHWDKMNEIGALIVKQPYDVAPFVKIANNLMVTNYSSGHLQLERGFPLDEICNMVISEYR